MLELLIISVGLLIVMPVLLYCLGVVARRSGGKPPGWIGLPIDRETPKPEPPPDSGP